jgi:hypothetical protein
MGRAWSTILAATVISLGLTIPAAAFIPAASAAATVPRTPAKALAGPQVRVNQVGYPSGGSKAAYVMLARPVRSVSFEVTTPYGVAYQGTSAADVGSWNSAYRAVYQLNFSAVQAPGVYRVRVLSPAAAVSPSFVIGSGPQLYRQLVDNATYTPTRSTTATTTCSAPSPRSAGRWTCPAAGSTPAAATRSSPTPPATPTR